MPTKLSTTVKKIDLIPNRKTQLISKFYEFMKINDTSERHQNNNLKAVSNFANYLGENIGFEDIHTSNQIFERWFDEKDVLGNNS